MSYELVPKNAGVPIFCASRFTYGWLLGCASRLCGETFHSIQIQPPKDDPNYQPTTWTANDRQQVKAEDAKELGTKLQEAVDRGEAEDRIGEQYLEQLDQPVPAEAQDHHRKPELKLKEFAAFLIRSSGFEIR